MRSFFTLFLSACTVMLSSCFQLVEEISLNADGSGTLSITLNLSQSSEQVNKILLQDTILGHKIPSKTEIDQELARLKEKLEASRGISDVSITRDFKTHLLKLSCNFSDVNALNSAILQIWKTYDKNAPASAEFVSFRNNVFSRNFDPSMTGIKTSSMPDKVKEVLEKGDYLLLYKFEREVAASRNPYAKIAPSGKAVLLKTKALPVIKGITKIDNEIKLK